MSKQVTTSGGIGFFGALTILFIGLKLGNVIDWSWVWVLSPLWLPLALAAALALLIFLVGAIIAFIGVIFKKD